ncbi:MAG: hypothetical protein EZS28_014886 [Streblomastix strix]|uniref:Uncharacterized protein n=1 Tax=Streblomastix strix TaxID=222440 RepID=A0A5J4W4Q1_9EUKA|nr:MAG: hypothetical protein EZS28_014886 [Streblomastix strix]
MELARQTHFRGYYLLNADIINLASSATGDFAFSAESGTVWMYESSWYDSGQLVPDQVTPASDSTPLVDGTASAGISTSYSRGDHVHPQQLTYDGNITATKFIKTGGTANDILLADGSTKQNIIAAVNSTTDNSIKFEVNTRTGFGQLQFNQHWTNGQDISEYQYLFIPTLATVSAFQGNITDILTTDGQTALPEDYSVIQQLFPNQYSTALQINPIINGTFNEGIRISRNPTNLWSNIQFGSDPNSSVGHIDNQWLIGSTGNNTVNPLRFIIVKAGQEGQSSGLQLNQYGNILYFYGQFTSGNIQLNPTDVSYGEGIRIANSPIANVSAIYIGTSTSSSGEIDGQWTIIKRADSSLTICRTVDQNTQNRGLQISADGNIITFNGRVL